MKKRTILCLIALLSLAGCSAKQEETNTNTNPQGCGDEAICDVKDSADMSAYEGFDIKNNQFIEVPMNDLLVKMDTKASGIFYVGYASCPWCVEAVPIMNEVAKEAELSIYYIDKKAETSDEETIQKVEERLADILEKDEEGKPHLYVPEVIVIKEGEIVGHHMGTLPEHDAHERKLKEEEQVKVKQIYTDLFKLLQ